MGSLFGILTSFGWEMMGFIIRSVIVKFTLFFAVYFMSTLLFPGMLAAMLPQFMTGDGGIAGFLMLLPDFVIFGLILFRMDIGLPLMISAIVTRFVIRRIRF